MNKQEMNTAGTSHSEIKAGDRTSTTSSREFRDRIVGKTITSVVARPGKRGQPPVVLMMHFDDGSVVEFVSPRSDRLLRKSLSERLIGDAVLGSDSANDSSAFELAQMSLPGCGMNGLN